MGDFFTFRRMITPVIIQAIFWIGVVVCIILGIVAIANGVTAGERIVGIVLLVLGPIVVRMYCEFFIVVFRINDNIADMRNHMLGGGRTEPRT
ncbi:MAG: DUF4282 domain-containing protein [Rhodospirillaceae bacterium]|nr:DUF4282 domain-containing protein [Rhodospirillaceae bacterium]